MPQRKKAPLNREEGEKRIRDYFARCEEKDRRPTRPGLRAALGLTETELRACEQGEGRWRSLREPVGLAMDLIRDELEQGSGNVNLFLLKQPCYGGYTDKPEGAEAAGGVTVRVSFEGEKGADLGG